MVERVTSVRTYVLVAIALLLLTIGTIGASFLNLGRFHVPVALTIATGKAALVVLFFMHARYSDRLTRVVIIVAILWLGVMIAGTMNDYLTRTWFGEPGH